MKEHIQKKEEALKTKENPGSIKKISRKAEKRRAWKKGKKFKKTN